MDRRASRESTLRQYGFISDTLHPWVMLYFLEHREIGDRCQGERVRELKRGGVQDQLGSLLPPVHVPSTRGCLCRDFFSPLLKRLRQKLYPLLWSNLRSHSFTWPGWASFNAFPLVHPPAAKLVFLLLWSLSLFLLQCVCTCSFLGLKHFPLSCRSTQANLLPIIQVSDKCHHLRGACPSDFHPFPSL